MEAIKQDISFLNAFYSLMTDHEIVMIYEGEFSQDITKSMLSMTESSFHTENVTETTLKKVYNIMMEVLQNICKHEFKNSASDEPGHVSLFMISSTETEFHIITGNAVEDPVIDIIRRKLDQVNALDQEGLKTLYKEARLNSTISEVGGAGLGFIDIARKSGNKIAYHFAPLSDGISYFTQMVTVTK